MSGFLAGMNEFQDYMPPLASQLLIELSEDQGQYQIRWIFNSEVIDFTEENRLEQCNAGYCDLDEFI